MEPKSNGTRNQFTLNFAFLLIVLLAISTIAAQQLQKGVHVQMAPTTNAQPQPAADNQNAWVIAITRDGHLFFGPKPVTRDGLLNEMISTPRHREQKLYIKADARAPYSQVEYVLKAAGTAEFDAPILLTAQEASAQPGKILSPKGLEVWVPDSAPYGPEPANLEVSASSDPSAGLRLNHRPVRWTALKSDLDRFFQGRPEKVVELKGGNEVPFAQIARAVDECRATGAKVVLVTPEI
ncbi:MAG TPA: biopolymer transporter ExbD [Candidatus Sulfotelmatobacter sp.]|jgi:biopolymer transport protein ExbD